VGLEGDARRPPPPSIPSLLAHAVRPKIVQMIRSMGYRV
jgi:hypothetical protein